jgi:predicted phage terminase large subunit-like protein
VQRAPDGHLDLWAREHYKSSIITVGLTIQEILADPEVSVGIFSHTRPVARAFLRQIKREFENNALLGELFPHIRPPMGTERRTWSEDDGITVRRRGNPKESTVEAWGLVDGQPTGRHFRILVYDDVVTHSSVSTPEMIAKTTEVWALSLNLGAGGGRARYIGTRYHASDTYAEMLRRGAAIPRIHPATADGTPEGEGVLFSREDLARKRRDMGPYVFGCQMLQNPRADAVMGFREDWLRYWRVTGPEDWEAMNRYILVDPAGERKAGGDYTVMLVVGLGEDGNYYLIDGLRDRLNLTEKAAALFRLHRRYRPLAVGYEKYGMQADVEHIRYMQERHNYRFAVAELGGQMPKNDRIRRLIPLFEQGRLFLPARRPFADAGGQARDLTRLLVEEEYLLFPVAGHDDMLDALARILDPDLAACFPLGRAAAERGPDLALMEWNPW